MALPPAPASTTKGHHEKGHNTMSEQTDHPTTRTAAETLTFADILAKAKPARRSVFIHLAGDLLARRDELEIDIEEAARFERLAVRNSDDQPERALGDSSETDVLVAELRDVLDALRASRTRFTFQVLPRTDWDLLRKRYEVSEGKVDFEAMSVPLVAACCVEPAMTEAEVAELFEILNLDQRQKLFEGAWAVNTGAVDIPFSPAGSAAEKARASAKR